MSIDGSGKTTYALKLNQRPMAYALHQNYPNPFNPATIIRFDLPEQAVVSLKVFNLLGQEVATPVRNEQMEEGYHSAQFDARNLPSGTYFYRLATTTENGGKVFQSVKKMVFLK